MNFFSKLPFFKSKLRFWLQRIIYFNWMLCRNPMWLKCTETVCEYTRTRSRNSGTCFCYTSVHGVTRFDLFSSPEEKKNSHYFFDRRRTLQMRTTFSDNLVNLTVVGIGEVKSCFAVDRGRFKAVESRIVDVFWNYLWKTEKKMIINK